MRLDLTKKSVRMALADVCLGARIAFAREYYFEKLSDELVANFEAEQSPRDRYRKGWERTFGKGAGDRKSDERDRKTKLRR